jgi:RNA polymerase sigma factor (sigma-70 family)
VVHDSCAGPDDPAAFLKWVQTYLIHHASGYLKKCRRTPVISLDAQMELLTEQIVDKESSDPEKCVLYHELQQKLLAAILSLRSRRYQQVLIYTYIAGVDECELAQHLNVPLQTIHMWRFRALKALQRKPEIREALRPLLE